jgi:hypothetical protein
LSNLAGASQKELYGFIDSLKKPTTQEPKPEGKKPSDNSEAKRPKTDKKKSDNSKFISLNLITVTFLGVISTIRVIHLFVSFSVINFVEPKPHAFTSLPLQSTSPGTRKAKAGDPSPAGGVICDDDKHP